MSRCTCALATPLIVNGAIVCGVCKLAPADVVASMGEVQVSSVRLPVDVDPTKPDRFNRACRSGRVRGAVKKGKFWICTAEAWANRDGPGVPRGIAVRKRKETDGPVDPELLHAFGLVEVGGSESATDRITMAATAITRPTRRTA